MKKSFIYSMAALLITGAVFTACSSSENDIENGQPEAKKYTLTVEAGKGEYVAPSATRSTYGILKDGNLQAYWESDDVVEVYHGDTPVGTLYAQTSDGVSTMLSGTISYTPSVNDELTLKYHNNVIPGIQSGTLEDLDEYYSAEAKVNITSINGSKIRASKAFFVAQCAIVRLNLLNANVDYLSMTVDPHGSKKVYETDTDFSVTSHNNVVFAVYGFDSQSVEIKASYLDDNYFYETNATVKNGDFYDIDITLVKK